MHLPFEHATCGRETPSAQPDEQRRRAFELARDTWPALDVSYEAFCAHLDALGLGAHRPLQLAQVYLCIACSQGQALACRQLEERYFPALRAHLVRFDPRPDVIDEMLQKIRYRLLVGPAPRIASYRGEGLFEAWLLRVASSVGIDFIRTRASHERRQRLLAQDTACQEHTHGAVAPPPDEELHRERCVRAGELALSRALRALPAEKRQLLHHYYVSQLTIDQLGAMYGCHRSAAARRLVTCVQQLQRALHRDVSFQERGGATLDNWWRSLYRRTQQADWLATLADGEPVGEPTHLPPVAAFAAACGGLSRQAPARRAAGGGAGKLAVTAGTNPCS